MEKSKKITHLLTICVLAGGLFIIKIPYAEAAELHLVNSVPAVRSGDTFSVKLFLNSPKEPVNALEGSVNFSSNLKLRDIHFSGSLVPLWVTKPEERKDGSITFAGVLPGGYQDSLNLMDLALIDGNVFTIIFEATEEGETNVSFSSNTKAYLNDGQGGRAELSLKNLSFLVLPSSGRKNEATSKQDILPPESFAPLITSGEPFGYAGRVLVFDTQDKDSGIHGYYIGYSNLPGRDSGNISWQEAESPLFMPGKNPKFFIYVKAVDADGNERIEVVRLASYTLLLACLLPLFCIIIVGVLVLSFRLRYIFRRPQK